MTVTTSDRHADTQRAKRRRRTFARGRGAADFFTTRHGVSKRWTDELRAGARRDAGDRRRVGLRQEHHGALAHAAGTRSAGRIVGGTVRLAASISSASTRRRWRRARQGHRHDLPGADVSLNPVLTIGSQIARPCCCTSRSPAPGLADAVDMLRQVRISEPDKRARPIPTSFPAACASAP